MNSPQPFPTLEPTPLSPVQRRVLLGVLAFSYLLIVWRILFVPLEGSERARNFTRGDGYSEQNAISTAYYYLDHPLAPTAALPVHSYRPGDTTQRPSVYTHYPAAPDLLTAFSAQLFQTRDARWYRVLPLLLSLLLVALQYWVLARWLQQPLALALSLGALWLSNYHIAWADNLHKHLLEELCKWGLWAYLMWALPRWRWWHSGLLFLLGVLVANVSFEPIVHTALLALGLCWVAGWPLLRWFTAPHLWALALGLVAGFVLHLGQNAAYMGSWAAALNDMTQAALMRSSGTGELPNEMGRALGWRDVLAIPLHSLNRVERFFLLPGWTLLILGVPLVRGWFRSLEMRPLGRLAVVVALCGLAWWVVMPQHALVHTFVGRHWGLAVGLLAGPALVYGYGQWLEVRSRRRTLAQVVLVALAAYTVAMALTQQVLDIWLRYSLLFPFFGR